MRYARLVLATLLFWPIVSTVKGSPNVQYVIADIQAKLYYSHSGRFSANIVNNPKIVLWNVIIGEGNAPGGASETTLIDIRVSGAPKSFSGQLKLHVTARTKDQVLLDKRASIGVMNTSGHYYAAFLINDTGCTPIDVIAELVGPGAGPPVKISLPFQCGE